MNPGVPETGSAESGSPGNAACVWESGNTESGNLGPESGSSESGSMNLGLGVRSLEEVRESGVRSPEVRESGSLKVGGPRISQSGDCDTG